MSALHKAAQYIFKKSEGCTVLTPKLEVFCDDIYEHGPPFHRVVLEKKLLLKNVKLESPIGKHRMDVVCGSEGGNKTAFEIMVTHKKSEADIQSFIDISLNVVEIDLSELPWDANFDQLRNALFEKVENRTFISHPVYKQKREWVEMRQARSIQRQKEDEKLSKQRTIRRK
jgi:hypothetical protein